MLVYEGEYNGVFYYRGVQNASSSLHTLLFRPFGHENLLSATKGSLLLVLKRKLLPKRGAENYS